MTPEDLDRIYLPRLLDFAKQVAEHATDAGLGAFNPPQHFTDEEAVVWLVIQRTPSFGGYRNRDYEVRFSINTSEAGDGTKGGVTFSLDCTSIGGRIIGGYHPFNYTPRCWVKRDDAAAVEERFKMLEDLDHNEVIQLILEDIEKTKTAEALWGEIDVASGKLSLED